MNKKYSLKIALSFLVVFILTILPSKAEEKRNFDSRTDIRVGPIFKFGYPFGLSSNLKTTIPSLSLDIHGESLLYGTTSISIEYFKFEKTFTDKTGLGTYLYEISPNGSKTASKELWQITLSSPFNYTSESSFELGWIAGVFSQNVNLEKAVPPSNPSNNSNIGLNMGTYIRYFDLFPLVPSASLKVNLGNMYDNAKTKQTQISSTEIKAGYNMSFSLDYYLIKRVFISCSYNLVNPDFFTFFPTTKAKATTNKVNNSRIDNLNFSPITQAAKEFSKITEPLDDPYFNYAENFNTVNLSLGFLF